MAKVVADERARGGSRGRPVLIVLGASMALLVVYLASFLFWSGSNTPTSPQQAASQATNAPAASSANTSRVPADNPTYPAPASSAAGTTGNAATPRP